MFCSACLTSRETVGNGGRLEKEVRFAVAAEGSRCPHARQRELEIGVREEAVKAQLTEEPLALR